MKDWYDEEVDPKDSVAAPYLIVGVLAFILALGIIGRMDSDEQAGCNLPADERTEQQNEDCGL